LESTTGRWTISAPVPIQAQVAAEKPTSSAVPQAAAPAPGRASARSA